MSDWQLSCMTLQHRGEAILKSGELADCTFLVGDDEKKRFSAHKLFLAIASPVFDRMFNGPLANGIKKDDCIEIPDVEPATFSTLLEYIYTDNINIKSMEEAINICYAADKYMLPVATSTALDYIVENVSIKDVCQAYTLARRLGFLYLANKCIQVIFFNTKELFSEPSFYEADLETVERILSMDYLKIDSELDLFRVVEKYAKLHRSIKDTERGLAEIDALESSKNADAIQTPVETAKLLELEFAKLPLTRKSEEPEPEVHEDLSQTIFRTLVKTVRFLTLTPQEFVEHVSASSFISKADSYALLLNIVSGESPIRVPDGFNITREPRRKTDWDRSNNIDRSSNDIKRSTTTFRFVVRNIQKSYVSSLPFYVQGLPWMIEVGPPDSNNYQNIDVFCHCETKSIPWFCSAKIIISVSSGFFQFTKEFEHQFTREEYRAGINYDATEILKHSGNFSAFSNTYINTTIIAEEPVISGTIDKRKN